MQEAEGKTEAPEKITTDTLWTQQQPRGWERSRRSPESSERSRDPTGVRNPPDLLPHLCLCSSCEYCSSPQPHLQRRNTSIPREDFPSSAQRIKSSAKTRKNPECRIHTAAPDQHHGAGQWESHYNTTELTVFINGDVHNYYGLYFILAHSWDC